VDVLKSAQNIVNDGDDMVLFKLKLVALAKKLV
jgi:hypothetical protein